MRLKFLAAASLMAISFAAATGLYIYLKQTKQQSEKPAAEDSRQVHAGYSLPTFIPSVRIGG